MQYAAVHAHDQHLLVVGAVEDTDAATLRQVASRTPEEVMLQFPRTWMLKAEDLAALGVDARHHMANSAIFACGIHRLKHQQQGVPVRCIEQALLVTQLLDVFSQPLVVGLLRLVQGVDLGGPEAEVDPVTLAEPECGDINIHLASLVSAWLAPSKPTCVPCHARSASLLPA